MQINWEQVWTNVKNDIGWLALTLVGAIPFLQWLRNKRKEKMEADKIKAESESIEINTADKLIKAAYEMMERTEVAYKATEARLNSQLSLQRTDIERLRSKVDFLEIRSRRYLQRCSEALNVVRRIKQEGISEIAKLAVPPSSEDEYDWIVGDEPLLQNPPKEK